MPDDGLLGPGGDRDDQRWAEGVPLRRRDLGRGWIDASMLNNEPRRVAYGGGEAADRLARAASEREPTALAEGRAWRRRRDGLLAVLRADVYRVDAADEHRAVFRRDAPAALAETWRARWIERDQRPGWVEARWVERAERLPVRGVVDWLEVEDHTGSAETGMVTFYEHVVVWLGRGLVTVTVRHPLGLDLDEVVGSVAHRLVGVTPPA